MNRHLLLLCCTFVSVMAFAQAKLFDKAIKEGRSMKSFYQIKNDKKMIKLEELTSYAKANGYVMGKYTRKEIGRFGDVAVTIGTFDFIPKAEFPQYICENTTGLATSAFGSKGTVYFYQKGGSEFFRSYNDVMWTGEVKNGKIHGNGTGFKQVDDINYICFSGTFNEGVLQGEGHFSTYCQSAGKDYYMPSWLKESTSKTGTMSDGMTWFLENGKYGFIDAQGHTAIKPIYQEVKNFSNGIAYVKEDKIELKINKMGAVVDISENSTMMSFDDMVLLEKKYPTLSQEMGKRKTALYQKDCRQLQAIYDKALSAANNSQSDKSGNDAVKSFINQYSSKYQFDPDNKVSIARELTNYYAVCDALGLSIRSSYWGYDGDVPYFRQDRYTHREMLEKAQQICSAGSNSSFSSFYAYAKPAIDSKYNQLSTTLASNSRSYEAAYSAYQAEQRAIQAKREAKRKKLETINSTSVFAYVRHEGEWSRGRLLDSDDDYTDHKEIVFIDIEDERETFTVTVYENRKKQYLWWSGGGHDYKTYADAVCAAYLDHYDIDWRKNRE